MIIELILLLMALISSAILIFAPDCNFMECIIHITAFSGILYCAYYLYIWIMRPIKRDWILIHQHFLWKVLCFVVMVPFVLTLCITGLGVDGKEILEMDSEEPCSCEVAPSSDAAEAPHILWRVYFQFMDPGNQNMATTTTGRNWNAVIAILGVLLLNGLLVSTLINWFESRKSRWQDGEIRYRPHSFWGKKFAVMIGANDSSPLIISRLLKGEGERKPVYYVIVLTNGDVADVRHKISSYLSEKDLERLIIYKGQLDSLEDIYSLGIEKATEIYIIGEHKDDAKTRSYHDTQNMKCVHNIAAYLTDKGVDRKIVCRVLFEYQTTYSIFQFSDVPRRILERLVFIPYSQYENWAQTVLVEGRYVETVKNIQPRTINYLPLDGRGIKRDDTKYVHLVVVGMSKMGVAMAIQAAQIAHFPNFCRNNGLRTRITFIDEQADSEMNFFKGRFQNLFAVSRCRYLDATEKNVNLAEPWEDPISDADSPYNHLGPNFIDVEWEFVKGNVEQPGVVRYLEQAAEDTGCNSGKQSILTVAVCLPLAHESIAASIYLPGIIYDSAQQVLVYQREASDIVYNLSCDNDNNCKRFAKLLPFGMQNADFTMNKPSLYASQLCNYVYSMIFDKDIDNASISSIIGGMKIPACKSPGDSMSPAREAWKSLSIFDKWSNKYLANSFGTKLRSAGTVTGNFTVNFAPIRDAFKNNMEVMAETEHNRWNIQQLLMGLRPYTDKEAEKYEDLRIKKDSDKKAEEEFNKYKKDLKKGPEKAHLNICSNEHLAKVDPDAKCYDDIFIDAIPYILKVVENAE